nr:MAG TPA: excisionase [Caudoviricetes sp.]DAY29790.1 MAG TPA: excisionase [Caudoviricetes sp.]
MDTQSLTRDIKNEVGNWPNVSQIARYLGKSREYVNELMRDCDHLTRGGAKQYLAADVAKRIMQKRVC